MYQILNKYTMKLIKIACSAFLLFAFNIANAQDDLMKELDSAPKEKVAASAAFKGLQICNIQSTKLPAKHDWYFLVTHRFGDVTHGLDNFFGLDAAYTRIGGIYGVTDWWSLGVSRHTYNKTFELASKLRFANQMENGFPFTLAIYNTMDVNSALKKEVDPALKFNNRLAFTSQLLISRKFNESVSLELDPIFVHKNLYEPTEENKDQFLIAAGGRFKVSKRMSLNIEYAARMNKMKDTPYYNPLSIGMDIDTGGHIFQLVFSNSQAMNDVAYFTNGLGRWDAGQRGIFFGFNMYRVF
jgi:hypothetical protein